MPGALPFVATRFCVKRWMPTFSSPEINLPRHHGIAQLSLDLMCGLAPWLDLCLINATLPGAPDSWLNLAVIFVFLAGGGGTSEVLLG